MAGGGDPRGQEPRTKDPGPRPGREAAGPTVVLLEGGQLLPIRSPCPGSLLPEAVTIPTMMERSTPIQAPAG